MRMGRLHKGVRLLTLLTAALLLATAGCSAEGQTEEIEPQSEQTAPDDGPDAGSTKEEGSVTGETQETVRVVIRLDKPSVAEAGYHIRSIATDPAAQAYRKELEQDQADVAHRIEEATGRPLDVVWNITLTANVISANVAPEDMELIRSVEGVVSVSEERLNQLHGPGSSAGLNPPGRPLADG